MTWRVQWPLLALCNLYLLLSLRIFWPSAVRQAVQQAVFFFSTCWDTTPWILLNKIHNSWLSKWNPPLSKPVIAIDANKQPEWCRCPYTSCREREGAKEGRSKQANVDEWLIIDWQPSTSRVKLLVSVQQWFFSVYSLCSLGVIQSGMKTLLCLVSGFLQLAPLN